MDMFAGALGGVGMVAFVLVILVAAVLWVILPFAIFGTKDLLKQLIREQRKTNELLASEQQLRSDLVDLRHQSTKRGTL